MDAGFMQCLERIDNLIYQQLDRIVDKQENNDTSRENENVHKYIQRPSQCDLCLMTFVSSSDCTQHVKKQHTLEGLWARICPE